MHARDDAFFRACGMLSRDQKSYTTGVRVHLKLSRQRLRTNAKETLVVSIMHARGDAFFRACGMLSRDQKSYTTGVRVHLKLFANVYALMPKKTLVVSI